MVKRIVIAITALAVAASAFPSSAAIHRTESQDYIGSFDPLSPATCAENEQLGMNIGVVCFEIKALDVAIDITVTDIVNSAPGFFYYILDADGECAEPGGPGATDACASAGFGCPARINVPLPSNARAVRIYPSGVPTGAVVCNVIAGTASAGAAAAGEVEIAFRR